MMMMTMIIMGDDNDRNDENKLLTFIIINFCLKEWNSNIVLFCFVLFYYCYCNK